MHDGHEIAREVLDSLVAISDWLGVWLNRPTPELEKIVREHPRIAMIARNDAPYQDTAVLNQMAALCSACEPHWCILADQDEIYPAQTRHVIRAADAKGKHCLRVQFITPLERVDQIIADAHFGRLHWHHKAFRWVPELCFNAGAGAHRPADPVWRGTFADCPWPLRHCAVMTPFLRSGRKGRKAHWLRWYTAGVPWRTVPFDPAKTYAQWCSNGK